MYQPTHRELLEMKFESQEWEGNIYQYNFGSLTYNVGSPAPWVSGGKPEPYPYWTLGSWYHSWSPPDRATVKAVINNFL